MKDGLPIQEASAKELATKPATNAATKAKAVKMRNLFEQVAPSYDSVTALVSLGLDRRWRRKAVDRLAELADVRPFRPRKILDACCGTGELTLLLAGAFPEAALTGIDFSNGMIERARQKLLRAGVRRRRVQSARIAFLQADMNRLPFADRRFDIVTVAFGLRNSVSCTHSLRELRRVLKPGGILSVLDCVTPRRSFVNSICRYYFHNWVPFVGGLVHSRHQYAHLPASIETFGAASDITRLLRTSGFTEVLVQPIFRDIVCHFIAT